MARGTLSESETIIRWDDEEQLVHVYSASPRWWLKLARLGFIVREETTRQGAVTGRFYHPMPIAQFRIGKKRAATESQRRRGRELAFLRSSAKGAREPEN